VACLLFGCACGKGVSSSDSAPPPIGSPLPAAPIGHAGRWLTDATGRALLLHGVNVVNKSAPYDPLSEGFARDDAAWLASNGFRVVRVGVLATGLSPSPGAIDDGYLERIASAVSLLASEGVFSLLDLHQDGWGPNVGSDGYPAWMTVTNGAVNNHTGFPLYYLQDPAVQASFQSFWDDAPTASGEKLQDAYLAMVSALAGRFAGEPYVLGYDLFNEPWPGTTYMPCLDTGGCASLDAEELAPVYAKAVAAIRAAGDSHLVLGEPFVLFNYGEAPTHIPVPGGDGKAGMSFHVYPLTLEMAPDVIDLAVSWAQETGGALLNTEWGATTSASAIATQTAALDSALVPWIFWSYCCEVVSALGTPPAGANLVSSTVSALVEPHPLAVAGTPLALSYDAPSRTMVFTWKTARAAGGAFPAGTITSFEIPALVYPDGYAATTTSGAVTSPAGAPLLEVVADVGASSVTVTVGPPAHDG
jgi:endoglycosylceramidase